MSQAPSALHGSRRKAASGGVSGYFHDDNHDSENNISTTNIQRLEQLLLQGRYRTALKTANRELRRHCNKSKQDRERLPSSKIVTLPLPSEHDSQQSYRIYMRIKDHDQGVIIERVGAVALQCCYELWKSSQTTTATACWKHLQPFLNVFVVPASPSNITTMCPELVLLFLQFTWATQRSFHTTTELASELLHYLCPHGDPTEKTITFIRNECAIWLLAQLLPRVQYEQQEHVRNCLDRVFFLDGSWKQSSCVWKQQHSMDNGSSERNNISNGDQIAFLLEYFREHQHRSILDTATLYKIRTSLEQQLQQSSAQDNRSNHDSFVSQRALSSSHGNSLHSIMPINSSTVPRIIWRRFWNYLDRLRVRILHIVTPQSTVYERGVVSLSIISLLVAWRKRAALWKVSSTALHWLLHPLREIIYALLPAGTAATAGPLESR
mmetsp:Transcript_3171/g.8932  ORF Transcript_3171/g.8932 Transcript_3171/m.8932 type:complete len:437 (+) Transcript_3171:259-1569(+)|eukprot:CAMPEP_0168773692 /NCGR_PEP_ID=MMETSP0725-20121227/4605_1 /TAXON_ID=265536 /ORGANISM="Amphiprora sp., Strain CCMP467" /LENGTH=436 /DNA_ID=CAMNT_0008823253 /DNA_START=126 /DNA_END=1436 /DNA_ORIENTATION=+